MAHILVIDDDYSVQSFITEVLGMNGHTFETAANGYDGVMLSKKTKFDLMIVDRNMPVMDGIHAVAAVRAEPKTKDVKIIMCTSCSVGKEVDEAFAAGANDYILKPINIQMLTAKVAKWTTPK